MKESSLCTVENCERETTVAIGERGMLRWKMKEEGLQNEKETDGRICVWYITANIGNKTNRKFHSSDKIDSRMSFRSHNHPLECSYLCAACEEVFCERLFAVRRTRDYKVQIFIDVLCSGSTSD